MECADGDVFNLMFSGIASCAPMPRARSLEKRCWTGKQQAARAAAGPAHVTGGVPCGQVPLSASAAAA